MTSDGRILLRDELFDLLVANPDGINLGHIMNALGVNRNQANTAIRDLRLFLGSTEGFNVPCIPQGHNEQWRYTLTAGVSDETREWAANRIADSDARLRTMRAMSASAVAATDGRQSDGKRARLLERTLRHLIEDLDALVDSD